MTAGNRGAAAATTAATTAVARAALIRAPQDRVWAVLTDFASMHRWFLGVRAVRLDRPPQAGAHRLVTFAGGLTQRETISVWSPPVHLALAVEETSGLVAEGTRVDIRLSATADGLCLDWSIIFRLNLGGLAALLSRPLIRGLVGAALGVSLSRLRRLAEAA
jgi:uncharacterized protein YndB with AHSA1/START domain